MARQRKSHDERKAEIIESALALAAEGGSPSVSTQAIADRVGIAQGTVFRHFASRDAIFRAALEWVAAGLFRALTVFPQAAPADERLRHLLRTQLAFVARHRGVPRLLFSDRLHLEDPELKATVRRIMQRYTAHVQGILQAGVEAGRFRPELDVESAARTILVLIQGTLMHWSVHDFSYPLEGEADRLWAMLWPAVAAPEAMAGATENVKP
jgi:TetR/AcrR family transcriptional regulator